MKKILYFVIAVVALLGCLVGCDNDNLPSGSGNSEITGSIAYFYGEEEAAIESFYSEDKELKQIELSKENTYTIGLRPSFRGSKSVVYTGDCATFSFVDGCCEITYIGEEKSHPVYEIKIKSDSDFDLTITVGDYSQTIKIIVKTSSAIGGDEHILFEYYFDIIATLDISDIKSVKSAKYAGSSSPQYRAPVEHKASALDTDIEAVFTWLKSLENNITPYTGELSDGGSSVCLTVYTSVGTLVLWEDADGYLLMGENYYSQNYEMPTLEGGETVTYTFESYYDDAKVYIDGIQIGTADFAFEDIVCERVDAEQHERLLWMDTCIGTIDVYSSQYFGRNGETYKIISGPNFTGIINKFFAAFDESTRVNFEVEHDSHSMGYGNDNHLYPNTYVFYEIEDFKGYCDTEGLTRVRDRISSLDGKTLIVVEFYTGSSADSFDVSDVGVSGDVLTIHFTDPESGNDGATAAWVHYAVIIVDKNDFSGEASDVRFTFFDDWDLIPPVVSGEKIEFNAKYHNSYNWNENKSYPSVSIIRSFFEFAAYCTEHSIRNDFYDEAYFQDKYLVAIIEETRYAGGEVLIESVVCYGDKYFVSLVSVKDDLYSNGDAAVMGERHCFIELDNSVPISAENNVIVYF